MRQAVAVLVLFGLVQGTGLAAQRGTPEYEKLKEYKKAQKLEREKANPSGKKKGFWAREAERSGFAGTGAMFKNAALGVISGEKPGSRTEA